MLTRNKSRSLVAQGHGMSGVSSTPTNIEADWLELPNELLVMIFEFVTRDVGDVGQPLSADEKNRILNCRLAHPQWQPVMDHVLEKRALEYWKKFTLELPEHDVNKYSFPVLSFHHAKSFDMENIPFPQFLQLENPAICPFPTKSLCLMTNRSLGSQMVRGPNMFSVFGHHLSSLTICENSTGTEFKEYFTRETLQTLLRCTPNLKALMLQNFNIRMSEDELPKFPLPPLAHLAYVKIVDTKYGVSNWILWHYHKQLINVESNCEIEFGGAPANFASLKELKLWYPFSATLVAPQILYPEIRSVLLAIMFNFEDEQKSNMQEIVKFISPFSNTLEELHLDVQQIPRHRGHPIKYGETDDSITNPVFSKLKTLSIYYPKYGVELEVVKKVLGMFPNLETLKFTRFARLTRLGRISDFIPRDIHIKAVMRQLRKENYQIVCKKLNSIAVHSGTVVDGAAFYTISFNSTP